MKKRPRLHLVGQDPTDVFQDLDQLRADLVSPQRRQRQMETFARIPHDKGLALSISGSAWRVLIEIEGGSDEGVAYDRRNEVGTPRWVP